MRRTCILMAVIMCCTMMWAQTAREYIQASTDRDIYLTGEVLHLRIDVTDFASRPMDMSKVAYVEIADTKKLHAQTMVQLKEGSGWADIVLPETMHSGYYQLNVYTRYMRNFGNECCYKTLLPVVNLTHVSREDRVSFSAVEASQIIDMANGNEAVRQYRPFEQINLPSGAGILSNTVMSVQPLSCVTTESHTSKEPEYKSVESVKLQPEIEGHIMTVQVEDADKVDVSRLALVGKAARIFDGQKQADGTLLYYTTGLKGTLPIMINAYDQNEEPVKVSLQSPYAAILADSLPELAVTYVDELMKQRGVAAQASAWRNSGTKVDSLDFDRRFLNIEPELMYDLDEYTRFKTVREILLEFVRGVQRQKRHGRNQLFTHMSEGGRYADCPALVLLDGVPVYDIDEFMDYDARRLKYVLIYNDRYSFGKSFNQGVISFMTHRGQLSDYHLDAGSQLYTYKFPQDRPEAQSPQWVPELTDGYSFCAPSVPGYYQIIVRGLDSANHPATLRSVFEVTDPM